MPKMTFEDWRNAVDREVSKQCGIGLDDLPDVPTRDWYDDGLSVTTAAKRAIKNLG